MFFRVSSYVFTISKLQDTVLARLVVLELLQLEMQCRASFSAECSGQLSARGSGGWFFASAALHSVLTEPY